MVRPWVLSLLLVAFAAGEDDRPERRVDGALQLQINQAIQNGVVYLKKAQGKDGSWKYNADQSDATGGLTALALYALAASRVPAPDGSIRRGIKWTTDHKRPYDHRGQYGTYSASLLVLALTRIDPRRHRKRIHLLADRLASAQRKSDMWTYGLGAPSTGKGRARGGKPRAAVRGGGGDNSNSQFAILALWAAQTLAGYKTPRETWQRVHDFYRDTQNAVGVWGYRPTKGSGLWRPTMAAAGLVSYVVATAALEGGPAKLPAARKKTQAQTALRVLLSLPNYHYTNYYFTYSLERVGTVMAVPESQWYVGGARWLVANQKSNGRWTGHRGHGGDSADVYATSLALLFLSRASQYAFTPGGRGARAVVTRKDEFPDPARELRRAFLYYHAVKPETRRELAPRFGRAGPAAVGLCVAMLRAKDEKIRATAYELLERLVNKRFLFEPTWPEADRKIMIEPIDRYWIEVGPSLVWDAKRNAFSR